MLAAVCWCLALQVFATGARADAPIEGVWSFNGGLIAIQEEQAGVFEGTVVSPTTFSLCPHPEGERIWSQMAEQPDGSYWGEHQWFFEASDCVPNPALGATAWRVLRKAEGRYLRVCLSEPSSNLQPTIDPSGAVANATFGCVDSALVSALPEVSSANVSRYVHLPSGGSCLSRQRLRIRITDPKNDPVKHVSVTASGGGVRVKAKIRDTAKGVIAVLGLGRIPGDRITVRVRVRTLLGERAATKRIYHRCSGG